MSNLNNIADNMIRVWKSLQNSWDVVRNSWKGTDRDLFEREHINEISQATNLYISNLRRFAEITDHILSEIP